MTGFWMTIVAVLVANALALFASVADRGMVGWNYWWGVIIGFAVAGVLDIVVRVIRMRRRARLHDIACGHTARKV